MLPRLGPTPLDGKVTPRSIGPCEEHDMLARGPHPR